MKGLHPHIAKLLRLGNLNFWQKLSSFIGNLANIILTSKNLNQKPPNLEGFSLISSLCDRRRSKQFRIFEKNRYF